METTLLYILHWFLLDAAEECAETDSDLGIQNNPFHYLYSIPTITVIIILFSTKIFFQIKIINYKFFQLFVYLFAPLSNHLKDIDFKSNLRLENGVKIWEPMNEYRHPENPCFTAHCRPKPRSLWWKSSRLGKQSSDIFVGVKKKNEDDESPPSQTISMCFSEQSLPANKQEDEVRFIYLILLNSI